MLHSEAKLDTKRRFNNPLGQKLTAFSALFLRSVDQFRFSARERLNTGLRSTQNQRVHIVCALVGINRF